MTPTVRTLRVIYYDNGYHEITRLSTAMLVKNKVATVTIVTVTIVIVLEVEIINV